MKKLVEYLVTSLVDSPGEVKIEEKITDQNIVYAIHVPRSDLGKVIGKKGRTAKAMRILVSALAAQQNKNISLEIVDPAEPAAPTEAIRHESAHT
ncbi:MAG: KH domain-containing protein [Myxococcaceae bacterium]